MAASNFLEHVLSAYTVDTLNAWAKHLGINLSSKLRKIARVRAIANCLTKFPQEVVKKLPSYILQLFMNVMDGKVSSHQYEFYLNYLLFDTFGLVYSYEGDDNLPRFQSGLVGVYKPIIEAEMRRRRETGLYKLEQYVIGFTNLYGSMSMDDFHRALDESDYVCKTNDTSYRHFEELVNILSLNLYFLDDGILYGSPFCVQDCDIQDKYDQKLFDEDFILAMGEVPFIKFNLPSAMRLESYMESKGIPHDEIQLAMTEMWWHHLSQSTNKEFLNIIGRYSPDVRTAAELYTAAVDFVNDLPMWQYKGHSANEVKEIEERKKRERDIRCGRNIIGYTPPKITFSKKPGRNDPCPCGSGKKYKHCCGR